MRSSVDLKRRKPGGAVDADPNAPAQDVNRALGDRKYRARPGRVAYLVFAVTVLAVLGTTGLLESGRRLVIRRIRILGQSTVWTEGWTMIDPVSRQTWERAKAYYEAELPKIRESAANFSVHSYFATVAKHVNTAQVGWYEIIGFRALEMARMLEEEGKDDYKVEKDKCVMMEFFQRNNFPLPPVFKVWRNKAAAINDLENSPEDVLSGNKEFPVFLKSCHLTQGSSKGTIPVKSMEDMRHRWAFFKRWINLKWKYRSDDWERPWAKDMNKLTDQLTPGLLVQGPFSMPKGPGLNFMELKVEVLYGRAYLAVANEPYKGTILTRDGVIEAYPTLRSQITNAAVLNPEITRWVQDEGHLPKVWAMAERAAKIIAVDEVRIDIFIRRGDPDGLAINENSLSSGMGYRMHFAFLARVWAKGHLEKWYKTFDNQIPVYQQTESTVPNFTKK